LDGTEPTIPGAEKKKRLLTEQHFSKKEYTHQHQIKNHTKPGNSQSRHQTTTSSTMKTIIVATRKNQENLSSHIRHLRISQVRRLKTYSLISRPPEGISQSRRLHHFPKSGHSNSRKSLISFQKKTKT